MATLAQLAIDPSVLRLAVRVTAFLVALHLLPTKILPRVVKLAVGISLLVFLLPIQPSSEFGVRALFLDAALSVALATGVCVAAYVAMFVASWLTSLMFSSFLGWREFDENALGDRGFGQGSLEYRDSVFTLVMLIFLCVLFSSGAFSALYLSFTESYANIAVVELPSDQGLAKYFSNVLIASVRWALFAALMLSVPFLFVAAIVDIIAIIANRYANYLVDANLVGATKIAALMLVFSATAYARAADIANVLEKTISPTFSKVLSAESTKVGK